MLKTPAELDLWECSCEGSDEILKLLLQEHPDLDLNLSSWKPPGPSEEGEERNPPNSSASSLRINQTTLPAIPSLPTPSATPAPPPTPLPFPCSPLLAACARGHTDVVRVLLSRPEVDPECLGGGNAVTPLFLACQEGFAEIAQLLLEDPRLHHPNKPRGLDGATPLSIACQLGRGEVVALLLADKRTDVNAASKTGATPLYFACQEGHAKVVEDLLRHPKIMVNKYRLDGATPVFAAALHGHLPVVELLLTLGRDIFVGARNKRIPTAAEAARWSSTQWDLKHPGDRPERRHEACPKIAMMLEEFFKAPGRVISSIRKKASSSAEPLAHSPKKTKTDPMETVPTTSPWTSLGATQDEAIFTGSDDDDDNDDMETHFSDDSSHDPQTLHQAHPSETGAPRAHQQAPIFNDPLLTQNVWAEPERPPLGKKKAPSLETQLLLAAEGGDLDTVISVMDSQDVDVNCIDSDHHTPLLLACEENQEEVVYFLLQDPRVDPNKGNKTGMTPFFIACQYGLSNLASILLSNPRTDPNESRHDRMTPLHIAARNGQLAAVQVILRCNIRIDVGAVTVNHHTAVDLAKWAATQGAWPNVVNDNPERRRVNCPLIVREIESYARFLENEDLLTEDAAAAQTQAQDSHPHHTVSFEQMLQERDKQLSLANDRVRILEEGLHGLQIKNRDQDSELGVLHEKLKNADQAIQKLKQVNQTLQDELQGAKGKLAAAEALLAQAQ